MSVPAKRVKKVKLPPTAEEIKEMIVGLKESQKQVQQDLEDLDCDSGLLKSLLPQMRIVPELIENAIEDATAELEDITENIKELENSAQN